LAQGWNCLLTGLTLASQANLKGLHNPALCPQISDKLQDAILQVTSAPMPLEPLHFSILKNVVPPTLFRDQTPVLNQLPHPHRPLVTGYWSLITGPSHSPPQIALHAAALDIPGRCAKVSLLSSNQRRLSYLLYTVKNQREL